MGLGTNLKKILKERKMTIKELSAQTGISLNTLYSITKRDGVMARFDIVKKICDVLNVSESELLGFDVQPEDYENIKNPRVHEVHRASNIRHTKKTKNENIMFQGKNYKLSLPPETTQFFLCEATKTLLQRELLSNFNYLNEQGQKKLYNYSCDLLKISEYKDTKTVESTFYTTKEYGSLKKRTQEGTDTLTQQEVDKKSYNPKKH